MPITKIKFAFKNTVFIVAIHLLVAVAYTVHLAKTQLSPCKQITYIKPA